MTPSDEFIADSQINLENIKKQEQVLLEDLKEYERKIRLLLAQLKAVRNLKTQATDQIEEAEEYELEEEILRRKKLRDEERERQEQEQVQSIDSLVSDVQTQRVDSTQQPYQTNTATQPLYNLPEDEVQLASDSNTIAELYDLVEKETLNQEERNRFFEITNAVVRSRPYELNELVSNQVDSTYAAIKTVLEKRPDLVRDYKPQSSTSPVNQFLESLKKSPVTDYKL